MLTFRQFTIEAAERISTKVTPGRDRDGQQHYIIHIKDYEHIFGEIDLIDKDDHLKISQSHIDKPYRYLGYGKVLYREAMKLAREKGKKWLMSGYSVSPDARRVWDQLGGEEFIEGRDTKRIRIRVDESYLVEWAESYDVWGFYDPISKEIYYGSDDDECHEDLAMRLGWEDTMDAQDEHGMIRWGLTHDQELIISFLDNKTTWKSLREFIKGFGDPAVHIDVGSAKDPTQTVYSEKFPTSQAAVSAIARRTSQ